MDIYVNEPDQKALACIIWLHGLGADAQDMAGLAEQLRLNVPVRHVFMDAPMRPVTINNSMVMRAWYDITGASLLDREDRAGILASEIMVRQAMGSQLADGFLPEQLFLAGFSQGGAMALFTAVRTPMRLGGVISLSAYLPLAVECTGELDKDTPFFIASGLYDPIVSPLWTKLSEDWLLAQQFKAISVHQYPMEHSICAQEIQTLALWVTNEVQRQKLPGGR